MRNSRKVWSFSTNSWIKCCWFECENPGYELYKSVFHEHDRNLPCSDPLAGHVNFVFCSERCKQYYLHSHVDLGNLPAGFKSVI